MSAKAPNPHCLLSLLLQAALADAIERVRQVLASSHDLLLQVRGMSCAASPPFLL